MALIKQLPIQVLKLMMNKMSFEEASRLAEGVPGLDPYRLHDPRLDDNDALKIVLWSKNIGQFNRLLKNPMFTPASNNNFAILYACRMGLTHFVFGYFKIEESILVLKMTILLSWLLNMDIWILLNFY